MICTETRNGIDCEAPATAERTHPNGAIDDLCGAHAIEFDAAMAEFARD